MKKTTEQKIISAILDKGLANSTFREKFPKAYEELLHYRTDLEADVTRILKRTTKNTLQNDNSKK